MKRRKKIFIFGCIFLIFSIMLSTVNVKSVQLKKGLQNLLDNDNEPSVVWVDDNYHEGGYNDGHNWSVDAFDNIQAGIDHVKDNGTVYVYNGSYESSCIWNKSLKLIANNTKEPYPTIINGAIKIQYLGVEISNFTIINSNIEGGIYVDVPKDIEYSKYGSVKINGCIIKNNNNYGIQVNKNEYETNLLTIIDHNKIFNNNIGIYLYESSYNQISNNSIESNNISGISISSSATYLCSHNNILNNSIQNNTDYGIKILNSKKNIIFNNNIEFNKIGIFGFESDDTSITYNNISLNTVSGVDLSITQVGSTKIDFNNIYANFYYGIIYDAYSNNDLTISHNFWGKAAGPWICSYFFYHIIIVGFNGPLLGQLPGEIIIYKNLNSKLYCKNDSPYFNRP